MGKVYLHSVPASLALLDSLSLLRSAFDEHFNTLPVMKVMAISMYLTQNENDSSWPAGEAARKASQNLESSGSILQTDSEILREFQKSSRGSFVHLQPLEGRIVFPPLGRRP